MLIFFEKSFSMHTIPEVVSFFVSIREDNIITPVHISLYLAIVQVWEHNNRKFPIGVCRQELMSLQKFQVLLLTTGV